MYYIVILSAIMVQPRDLSKRKGRVKDGATDKIVILFAEMIVPEAEALFSDHTPVAILKSFMAGILTAIGQHKGTTITRRQASVAVYFAEAAEALRCSIDMQRVTRTKRRETGYPLEVRIAADYGWNGLQQESLESEAAMVAKAATSVNEGTILVSEAMLPDISLKDIEFHRVAQRDQENGHVLRFLKAVWPDDVDCSPAEAVRATRFAYGMLLRRGKEKPCFYCGSRNHLARNCPSKLIREMTQSLHQMGYSTIREINAAFQYYLSDKSVADQFSSPDGLKDRKSVV
jgi:hypothetical protein